MCPTISADCCAPLQVYCASRSIPAPHMALDFSRWPRHLIGILCPQQVVLFINRWPVPLKRSFALRMWFRISAGILCPQRVTLPLSRHSVSSGVESDPLQASYDLRWCSVTITGDPGPQQVSLVFKRCPVHSAVSLVPLQMSCALNK